uniref:Putative secreted peptide n=1 Tax=Hybomitra bimaculata TaxID=226809 RepID=Q7YW30_HYBBI|nr:putative secreted peptide [Hybomitra bimaculata]
MLFKTYVFLLVSLLIVGLFTSCDADPQYEDIVTGYLRKGGVSGVDDFEPIEISGEDYDSSEGDEDGKE